MDRDSMTGLKKENRNAEEHPAWTTNSVPPDSRFTRVAVCAQGTPHCEHRYVPCSVSRKMFFQDMSIKCS